MDEDDDAHERRRRERATSKQPKHKYVDLMQKLSDRSIDEVLIELDDLVAVRQPIHSEVRGITNIT